MVQYGIEMIIQGEEAGFGGKFLVAGGGKERKEEMGAYGQRGGEERMMNKAN